jgi:NarL family two-component system response regulator LiaR
MKILLADDHNLFLEGIRSVIKGIFTNTEFECVNDGHQALQYLSNTSYDIALIDLRLPGIDGFQLLDELSKSLCLTPIIIVTASEDPWDIDRAMQLGAMGFVSKSSNGKQIQQAIESVLQGDIVKPTTINQQGSINSTPSNWAKQHNLTPRQLEVLRLIRHGLSNKAIAEQLSLSLATVKTHIVAIFHVLETQSRTETIKKAQQLGLD